MIQAVRENVKLCNKIYYAYHKAPYFKECYELIEKILNFSNNNVSDYIYNSLKEICSYLNIITRLLHKSEFEKPSGLNAQETVIYICNRINADRYINAIGGMELYCTRA